MFNFQRHWNYAVTFLLIFLIIRINHLVNLISKYAVGLQLNNNIMVMMYVIENLILCMLRRIFDYKNYFYTKFKLFRIESHPQTWQMGIPNVK